MALNLTKLYTPSAGQAINANSYNTDITQLFNCFSGIESGQVVLNGTTVTPSANGEIFKVNTADGTPVLNVDTNLDIISGANNLTMVYETTLAAPATSISWTHSGNRQFVYCEIFAKILLTSTANDILSINATTHNLGANGTFLKNIYRTVNDSTVTFGSATNCEIASCDASQYMFGHIIIDCDNTITSARSKFICQTGSNIFLKDTTLQGVGTASPSYVSDYLTGVTLSVATASNMDTGSHIMVFARSST